MKTFRKILGVIVMIFGLLFLTTLSTPEAADPAFKYTSIGMSVVIFSLGLLMFVRKRLPKK